MLWVPVTLAGMQRSCDVKALIDTGTTRVTLHPKLAKDLGYDLAQLARERVVTGSGLVTGRLLTLKSVRLRELVVNDLGAITIEGFPWETRVLLGLDFLLRFTIHYDPSRRTLKITKPGSKA